MCQIGLRLGKSLGEVGAMDAEELSTWAAFFGMEESRDEEAQWRAGMIAATVASCATGKAWKVEDFRPARAAELMSPDEYLAVRRSQWARRAATKE